MKCPYCQNNEATLLIDQVTADGAREVSVCEACAKLHGFQVQLSLPVLDEFLFGTEVAGGGVDANVRCPACHMHSGDLQKSSLMGCGICYDTFTDDVDEMLESMQKGRRHYGKVPRSRRDAYMKYLEQTLLACEAMGNVTEVKKLKARMRELSGSGSGSERNRAPSRRHIRSRGSASG